MKYKNDVLALVLAGGKGERLHPLTLERTKPSVPFGGKYRIIDFALSNMVNSGIYSIYVMVQYKSQSLIEHIRTTWQKTGVMSRHFVTVVPPQMRKEELKEWYRGTADSVYQNINLVYDFKPKFVAIFGGDHVYRMNIKEMLDYHIRNKAGITLSVVPVQAELSHHFGIVGVDSSMRVKKFTEKPLSKGKGKVFASMGNYIFNTETLIRVLEQDARKQSSHDFGRDIIPALLKEKQPLYAYDFTKNRIPSLKKYEDRFYWKDVGTIKSYWDANMDLLGVKPRLDLDNREWPIYASNLNCPPLYVTGSVTDNSLIGEGSRVCGSEVRNSILGRGVKVDEGCVVKDSIIMDFSHIGRNCKINKAIIDRLNVIGKGETIGFSKSGSKYYLDSSGITVVKRGARKDYYF